MYTLLLTIIYIAFISLGLPDSLIGSAWPVMRLEFGASIDFAGVISMIIAGSTIVSSLLSDRLTWKLGTGLVTAVSVGMTALALFGFSSSTALWQLCLWAVPYGLGAGAIDAGLNNYVALHYNSRHMSWLHCFWGVGASVSPYIMGHFLTGGGTWDQGFLTVSLVQVVIAAGLFLSLPVWRINAAKLGEDEEKLPPLGLSRTLKIRGVFYILIAFFCYCSAETTAGLWATSFLVESRGIDPEVAAHFASLFYLGITGGRFLNGFISDRAGDRRMIRVSVVIMLLGAVLIMLPVSADTVTLSGLVIFGLGCAPVYPSIIHSTPDNFGKRNSQAVIGVQMASAYAGSTFMPAVFGLLAKQLGTDCFPFYLLLFTALLLLMTELLNRMKAREI